MRLSVPTVRWGLLLALLYSAHPPIDLTAQAAPVAFRGARIIPVTGPEIPSGTVVVQGGKILAVGANVAIPAGATVVDATRKVIMPGIVDTHSHIGGGSGGDRSDPIQGDVRILDAIDPRDDGIQRAQAGGLTTVNIMPGSGHLMSGQTAYVKLRDTTTVEGMLFCHDIQHEICGGMKMANGTNSRGAPPFPGTRGKSAALVREQFVKAQEYQRKVAAGVADSTKRPERNLEMEALVEVLEGRRIVHFHTHRADDILTVLRLQREFGFKVVLHHVSEGWRVAREIAAAHVPASVIVIDAPGGKLEATGMQFGTGAALDSAGVLVGFHTDDGITDSRWFLRSAALAMRAGLSRETALRAMTINGATMLGLDGRVGSLEVGKDADLVILSGDPFAVTTHVEQTWVDGVKVFDLSNPRDRLYAEGGYDSIRDGIFEVHTDMEDHD
ncbi:MAG TPA: amidohydrolase family protein [Gemmatimonadales bacterium]|nr:amidohydrolase family protein [Gemmatimonadales bacterium]